MTVAVTFGNVAGDVTGNVVRRLDRGEEPRKMTRTSATIVDVAREAGVSVSTVSRIVNGKPDVAEETRERVLDVIKTLRYVPHTQAKRLKLGESRTVAMLDPVNTSDREPISAVHLDFMIGAAHAAGERDYLFNVMAIPITPETMVDLYRGVQIDGAILMEVYLEDWRVEVARDNGFPFVMIGRQEVNSGITFLDLDIETAVHQAYDHLATLGHEQIGFIAYPDDLRTRGHGPAVRAWQGFLRATESLGISRVSIEAPHTISGMNQATAQLLDRHGDLTAIVAPTDAPVAGIFSALRERELSVPGDISVVGLAVDRIAELLAPRLTAVRFPSYEMGHQATNILIDELEGLAPGAQQVLMTPELVERDSTGSPS